MGDSFGYKLKKNIFRFIGDIRWHGLLHPFWFTINATTFRLKGQHYRAVKRLIRPGDILLRRFEGYVDKWFIPGFWNHAGIYIGYNSVVHSISDGVVCDDLIDFMRTDHLVVLRPPTEYVCHAVDMAKNLVGREYDFAFDFCESIRFSCTELINYCYDGLICGRKYLGRNIVVADDIFKSCDNIVWSST